MHGAVGLAKKRPDLRIDRVQDAGPEPAFAGVVDELYIRGFRLNESVLVYRPARSLVVADLVHNVGKPERGWTTFYTKTMGFYDRVALSRMLRWTAFSETQVKSALGPRAPHRASRLCADDGQGRRRRTRRC